MAGLHQCCLRLGDFEISHSQGELRRMQFACAHLHAIFGRIPFLHGDGSSSPEGVNSAKIFIGQIEGRCGAVKLRLTLHLGCLSGFYVRFSLGQGTSIKEPRHLWFDGREHRFTTLNGSAGPKFYPVEEPGNGRRDNVTVTDPCLALFEHGYDQRPSGHRGGLDTYRFWPESGHDGGKESRYHDVGDNLSPRVRSTPDTRCRGLKNSGHLCFHHSLAFKTPRRSSL